MLHGKKYGCCTEYHLRGGALLCFFVAHPGSGRRLAEAMHGKGT